MVYGFFRKISPGDWLQFVGSIIGIIGAVCIAIFSNKKQYELNRELENELMYKNIALEELKDTKDAIKTVNRIIIKIIKAATSEDKQKLDGLICEYEIEVSIWTGKIISIIPFLNGYNEKDKQFLGDLHIKDKLNNYGNEVNKIINSNKLKLGGIFPKNLELFAYIMDNKFSYEDSHKELIKVLNEAIDYNIKSLRKSN